MGHPQNDYMNSIWVCPILTGLSKIVPQYLPKLGGKNGALPSSQAPSQPEPQPRGGRLVFFCFFCGISMPFLNMDRWVSISKTMVQTRFQPLHIYIYISKFESYIYTYVQDFQRWTIVEPDSTGVLAGISQLLGGSVEPPSRLPSLVPHCKKQIIS